MNIEKPKENISKKIINSFVGFLKQFTYKKVYVTGIIGGIIGLIIALSMDLFVNFSSISNVNNDTLLKYLKEKPGIIFIFGGVIAPFYEEVIFRKLFFGILNKKTNFYLALIVSSLLFTLIHFQKIENTIELITTPFYFIPGVIFALVYNHTDCILTSIISHMIANLASFTIIYLGWL